MGEAASSGGSGTASAVGSTRQWKADPAPVPAELMRSLASRGERLEPELLQRWETNGRRASGSWAQVFGEDEWGQEVFTAWHYARFVQALVEAGKARYDIPMYANVALNPGYVFKP